MLTVVMATKNRAHLLGRVLDSFAELQSPRGGWKLIAVDNGSIDGTPEVLKAYADRLPIQVLLEPTSGMNAALNAALGAVEGDLLVKTDDDVLPCPGWLVEYRKAADEQPDRSVFGGTVSPEWPAPLPHWLTERAANFGILYARSSRLTGPCALSDIYGPNWAIRSEVFSDGTRFDERIGPDSTQSFYPMGGETELFSRLQAKGHLGWFVSEATIRHIVRPEQITERWILDRAYRNGLGVLATCPPDCAKGPRIGGMPARLLLRTAMYGTLAGLVQLLPPSELRLGILFRRSLLAGLTDSIRRNGAAPFRLKAETVGSADTQARSAS